MRLLPRFGFFQLAALVWLANVSASTAAAPDDELLKASARGKYETVKSLLDSGANIDARDPDGSTALMKAAWNGQTAVVLHLLARGADVGATNHDGENACVKAGQRGFTDIIQLLENAGAGYTPIALNDSDYPAPNLPMARRWALATVAVSNQQNGFSHELLGGEPVTPQTRTNAIYGLKNWWGVTAKQEVSDVLDWLYAEGHHKEYNQIAALLEQSTEVEYLKLLDKYSDNPEVAFKFRFVREHRERIGSKSLLAWDMCRYIQVAGLAYVAGYYTEDEAWEKIMPAARLIQSTFTSWQDMGDNYLAGRAYWAGERNERLDYIYGLLRNPRDPNSPWNRLRWDLDLGREASPADKEHAGRLAPRAGR